MCCEPWGGVPSEGDKGSCKSCDAETYDGQSADICGYSPTLCEECGDAPCDESC